jgi:hypothetical protein
LRVPLQREASAAPLDNTLILVLETMLLELALGQSIEA